MLVVETIAKIRLEPPQAVTTGNASSGVLLDPLRAAVDGAARLRPVFPLVRRARHRRCCLGSLDLLQKPRPTPRWRCRRRLFVRCAGAAQGEAALVDRTLLD